MNLRQRLLLLFSLTVVIAVAAVSWGVSLRTREAFAKSYQDRADAFAAQFHREFERRSGQVADRITRIATSDRIARMAFDLQHGGDTALYLSEASALAQEYDLEFLEIAAADGSIISSAQWPARFGYKEILPPDTDTSPYLKREELPEGSAVGMFAARSTGAEGPLRIIGGERLDRDFLESLPGAADARVLLYSVPEDGTFQPQNLVGMDGPAANADKYLPLIRYAIGSRHDVNGIVSISNDRKESLFGTAIPLKDRAGSVISVLLVSSPRRGLIELQEHIRVLALGIGGVGILLAIAFGLWITARITRPVERLAEAARGVAAGDWNVRVDSSGSRDEVGELADAFNRMTSQLLEQRDRLVQTERVAAWRELARRLAHELKNPLFPLQITVENLVRARQVAPEEFDEIFRESTSTLMAEIANLKTIVGRFSDFSKMPQPQLRATRINEVVNGVATLHEPVLAGREHPVRLDLRLDRDLPVIAVDPELLHRALSNLVLNALDAMPEGGAITITTASAGDSVRISVSDTGSGLTPEECKRLFTPYYTTKTHGTGLGLAIVQSVVTDHRGSINVESTPGSGTTFIIDLPKNSAVSGVSA